MLLAAAIATLTLTVTPGETRSMVTHRAYPTDVHLTSVQVNGHPMRVGDEVGDRAYMYGYGLVLSFEQDRRGRFRVTVASVAKVPRTVMVRYRINAA